MSTIRGLPRLDTFVLATSGAIAGEEDWARPPSPHSGLPSPSDSVSSFPSVSSSFLFSSGPGSPPHSHPESRSDAGYDHDLHDSTSGLVIPSLTLPAPAPRPTPYGQTLGDLRLLILAPRRAASSTAALVASLIEDNDDIVEQGSWEELLADTGSAERASVLRASTAWVEQRDAHGLECTEPARNVEIVELSGYDSSDDVQMIVDRTLPIVHAPFYQVLEALNPEYAPSAVLANLLSSSSSPLYTAMILLLTSSPNATEKALLDALSPHIPLIVIPPLPGQPAYPSYTYKYTSYPFSGRSSANDSPVYPAGPSSPILAAPLSAFRPSSPEVLRGGLFRTPETIAHLRAEGSARFLRWREVERAVARISASSGGTIRASGPKASANKGKNTWDKAQWEAQWEGTLSQDIAAGLQRRKRADIAVPPTQPRFNREFYESRPAAFTDSQVDRKYRPCVPPAFDPLHVGSLVAFSLSLLGPLRARIAHSLGVGMAPYMGCANVEKEEAQVKTGAGLGFGLGLALVGVFCAGLGLGLLVARR